MAATQLVSRNVKDGGLATADLADASVTLAKLADAVKPALSFRNKIINGNFRWWQRGTSVTLPDSTGTWLSDRWQAKEVTAGVMTYARSTTVPDSVSTYSALLTVTTVDTSVGSGDHSYFATGVEGYLWGQLRKDSNMTLSFYVKSTTTGTYCVSFRTPAGQYYIKEYTIIAANTWEQKTMTIPTSTGGTEVTGTGLALTVAWAFMAGSTLQGTANAWGTGNLIATSNQTNLFATVSNNFFISQVQLEAGSTATAFEQRNDTMELLMCQRYYETSYPESEPVGTASSLGPAIVPNNRSAVASLTAGNAAPSAALTFKVDKRVTPTIVLYDFDGTANAVRVYAADAKRTGATLVNTKSSGPTQFLSFTNASAPAVNVGDAVHAHWTADAEFSL